jgi:hypothetical protein
MESPSLSNASVLSNYFESNQYKDKKGLIRFVNQENLSSSIDYVNRTLSYFGFEELPNKPTMLKNHVYFVPLINTLYDVLTSYQVSLSATNDAEEQYDKRRVGEPHCAIERRLAVDANLKGWI